MLRSNIINPYLQMSRLVGKELDFTMVQYFVDRYIDDAVKNNNQTISDASNDLKEYFVNLSDAIFQATINYDSRNSNYELAQIVEIPKDTSKEDDDLLNVSEVSKALRVTPQQVRNMISAGKLPSIKVSERGTRIKKSELDKFMENRNLKKS